MRDGPSRTHILACRLPAARFIVSAGAALCMALFATGAAAQTLDYGDHSLFPSASSTANSKLRIGATTDKESIAVTNATATGDDTTGSDDEDGVTLPASITPGVAASMTVNVTNTSGASAYLNIWIDFNGNGTLTDSGEQIATNTAIATGTSNSNRTVSFTPPTTMTPGTKGVRVRLTSTSSPGPDGTDGNGEVEDHTVTGPSVDGYHVLVANYGAYVNKYNENGAYLNAIGAGSVTNPSELAVGPDGNVYVSSESVSRIDRINPYANTFLGTFIAARSNGLSLPGAMFVGADNTLYIGDYSADKLLRFNATSGAFIGSTTVGGTYGMNIDSNHKLVILAEDSARVDRYSTAGVFEATIHSFGSWMEAHSVAIDSAGNYYICNVGSAKVDKITPGGVRSTFATLDAGSAPFSLGIGPDGKFWVGDVSQHQIEVFNSVGTFVQRFSTNVNNPCGLVIVPNAASDFGDLPMPYPTRIAHNGARHIVTSLKLGSAVDVDGDGQTSLTANGDDTDSDGDDEDGVTFPTLNAGSTASVTVTSSANGKLNAFFDWNNDKDFADSGETITEMSVVTGSNTLSVPVPSGATTGVSLGARFRLSSTGGLAATGAAVDGEVEDYLVTVNASAASDFGDHNAFGSASSTRNNNLRIGATVDTESIATTNANATGDDTTGSDDEDGVTLPVSMMPGVAASMTVNVTNTLGSTAYLNAWIDFNGNGILTDSGEQIAINTVIATGTSNSNRTISFTPPTTMTTSGTRGVRVRLTSTSTPGSTGASGSGEVEDYALRACPLMVVCPAVTQLPTGTQNAAYSVQMAALGGTSPYTYSIATGSLPSGLTLNSSSGVLGGTPSSVQSTTFTVAVTDSTGCQATRSYKLDVAASGTIITVVGDTSTNNVPVQAASYLVSGATRTQNSDLSGTSVFQVTNSVIDLKTLTINDNGTTKTLNVANLNGGTVNNVTVSSSATNFGVHLNGATTSISSSGLTNFRNSAAQISTNTNLNHYIFDDRGEGEPDATGEYDILFNYAFTGEDYIVLQERFGNSHIQLQPLDATGNVIAGSRTVQVRGTHDWNTGYASNYLTSQPYFLTVIRQTIFGTTSPVFGFRLSIAGADCKFFGMSDNPFTDNPTSAGVIGDKVWNDANKNGVQDAGEAGISGATVRLLNAATSATVATTTTNSSGIYNFTAVAPGDYQVEFVLPASYTFSSKNAGGDERVDSDANTSTGKSDVFTMLPCDSISYIDAGMFVNVALDYGDHSGFGTATQAANSAIRIGTNVTDSENSTLSGVNATGDDLNGTDDEDLNMVNFFVGTGNTLSIPVTITPASLSGSTARLNVFVDWNGDNDVADANETQTAQTVNASGTYSFNLVPPFGTTAGNKILRIRITEGTTAPAFTGESSLKGEVEDYLVIVATSDYGDYSEFANASSTLNSNLRLGSIIEAEQVAVLNATATGDDTTNLDDEDGVTVPASIVTGTTGSMTVNVTNNTGATAYLNAWIDFNNNGVLTDAGEQVATNTTIATGTSNSNRTVSFTVPAAASIGTAGVRVRLTSISSPGSDGADGNGEVEDYTTSILGNVAAGNLVWVDANDNGRFDTGEGVSGVTVQLLNTSNVVVGTATTDAAGLYQITTVAGTYYLKIPASEFASGEPLFGRVSLLGNGADNGRDDDWDENGIDDAAPATNGIRTPNFTLTAGSEPTTNETGQDSGWDNGVSPRPADANADLTQDFGFAICTQTNLLANGSFETANPSNLTFTNTFPSGGSAIAKTRTTQANTDIANWTFDSGSYVNDSTRATDGSRFVYLDRVGQCVGQQFTVGSVVSGFTQLTAGNTYTLMFDWVPFDASAPNTPPAGNNCQIYADFYYTNSTWSTSTLIGSFSDFQEPKTGDFLTNPRPYSTWNSLDWRRCRYKLVLPPPPSGQNYLTVFITAGGSSGKLLIDNVRLTQSCVQTTGMVGNLVFNDTNNNGLKDAAETGIDNVLMHLYRRPASGSPIWVGDAYTTSGGRYFFAGMAPGNYFVQVDPYNFAATTPSWWSGGAIAGPLYNKVSSAGNGNPNVAAGSASDDDASEKGVDDAAPATNGIVSPDFALGAGTEPLSSGKETGAFNTLDDAADSYGDMTIDFGFRPPATLDFGDHSSFLSASSTANTKLRIGAAVDAEAAATTNSTATGDDTTGTDDEDGVTLPASIVTGTTGSMTVNVSNSTGATAYLNAWIDFNRNGVLTDAGEQIASNTTIATGTSNSNRTVTFSVPATATAGAAGVRVRLTSVSSPGADGTDGTGEVEDHIVTIACPTVTVNPASLTTPTVGTAYSQTVTQTGGNGTIAWSVSNGTLPTGLTLNGSTGIITGTPTNTTAVSFTVQAADAGGCVGTRAYSVTPVCPTVSISPSSAANGTLGIAYSQTLTASGGTAPYSAWTVTNGTLPTGLTLNSSTGVISGTPTASNGAGTTVTVRVTDTYGCTGTQSVALKICPVVTVNPTALASATVGTAYSQTVTASGGATSYSYSLASGTLPAGLTLNATTGVISGTPTATTSQTFVIRATDANGCTGTRSFTVAPACPAIAITPTSATNATLGIAYSQTLTASGGTSPYSSWTVTSGTLPAGLTLNASTGVISGTPTASNGAGTTVTFRVSDTYGCTGTQAISLKVCPVVTVNPTTLAAATIGTAYSQTFTGSGGASAYSFSVVNGTLPTGLALNATSGVLNGTPTVTTSQTFTIRATDANGCAGTRAYTVAPVCPAVTVSPTSVANGTLGIAYSQTLTASGGTAPYSNWTVTSGTLPAGLTLNASTGVISGTPTASNGAGTTVTIRASDAYGCTGTQNVTLKICPVVTVNPTTLAAATVGTAYSQTFTGSGGASAYTYSLASGTLPAGLSLDSSTGALSGTPTATTSQTFVIRATDANGCTGTRSYTVAPVCPTITITPTSAANGQLGVAYSQTLSASGGTAPYGSWTVTSGTLPAGLTLNAGTGIISGTPTASNGAGTTVTFRVSDTYGCTGTRAVSIKICPVVTVNPATLATATVGTAYNQTFTGSGGASAYTFSLANGTLPTGLSLNTSSGTLSGTPTATTSQTFTIRATDANGCAGTRSYTVAPVCPTISISPTSVTNATLGIAYSQTLTPSGGTAPYGSWTVTSGTLPAGLTLNASTGVISGTPTASNGAGTTVTFSVTDTYGCTGTQAVSVKVCPVIGLSPATLANGTINSAYSQTIGASGGLAPYTLALVSGTVPAGLTFNATTGVLSGTPTSLASATFVIRATDANGCIGSQSYTVTPAPDSDFGDYSAFSSASSRVNSTLKIGATTDAEGAATTNSTATGDDTTGSDDEDGVTLPASIVQGGATTITVNVTNTSGATAYLNVWVDFNQNGVLTDAGEQVATNTAIATGTSNSNRSISFTAPANATLGATAIRARLTSIASPGPDGVDGNGEVEDHAITITPPTTDYGDFSLFADAFSTGVSGLKLGALTDLEGSATKNATATGDDTTGSDDEDGVTFPSMTAGQPISLPVTLTNTTGAAAYLNAWIDFNNNGVLTDSGEQIATDVSVATGTSNGTVTLNFTVPTNAVTAAAAIGTRFRITSLPTPGPTGGSGNGEVEDHAVVILAPLTDFGDFSGASDVSNTASTNLRLGTLVDTEYASTRNATATGDDTIGSDDEDGVTVPSMIAGAPATIPVVVTNNTGAVAYLNAWIDYNNNGSFNDAGEQIVTNTSVSTGTTNSTSNVNITVPATAVTGTNLGLRVRISSDISPGSAGSGGVGEVEDYVVNIAAPTTDFGDLSTIASASSNRNSALRMGSLLDTEYAATANPTATGDDITGSDDEDGVTIPSSMIAGGPATIPVVVSNTTGAPAYLNAWIDFNGNGVLTDAGEQIATNVAVATGTNAGTVNLSITVPPAALTAVNLAARFRLVDVSGAAPTGAAGNGEVEDYLVNITAPTTDFGDFSGFADASQGVNPSLRLGASVDAEYAATKNTAATGDDTSGTDDEDGVTIPSLTAGQTVAIPVVVTNNTGAPAYLNAWIDFNNNGVLTDSGEQIAANMLIATGTNGTVNLTVAVPVNATTGVNVGARFRLSAPSGLGSTGANGFSGEIEDYAINIAAPVTDYGDFSGFGSASNLANATLRLGALVDAEYNPTTNATATGDDTTGSDDEDGVTLPTATAGQTVTIPVVVTNTTGSTAYLNAWIDYNNNGVLTDAGEQITTNTSVTTGTTNGTVNLSVTVPANATTGTNLGVRFRLSATASPGPLGSAAVAGEVEDYIVNLQAPTTDLGDFSGFADASNGVSSNLRLGALTDAEFAATKNAAATGDDITGSDDEDGVTLPSMIAGQTVSIPVVVTNTLGAGAYLNAWIDYNNNGVLTDAGEQIATNTAVTTGTTNGTVNVAVAVPATAVTGTNLGVRFRLTATATPGATGSGGGVGEVEDYVVNIAPPSTDFGDFSRFVSASSTVNANLRIGATADTEYTATLNTTATGDDITGSDDEDGVTFPSMTAGQTITLPVTVTNTSGSPAYLNVWFDFNNNGVLTDSGEQVATNVTIPTGTTGTAQNLTVTIPVTAAVVTDVGVRVRLTSVSSPGSTGAAGNGEVEDHVVQFARPLLDYGDWSGATDAASTANSNLRLGATVDTEYTATKNATATGDDITLTDDEDGVTPGSLTAGAPGSISITTTNLTGAAAYLNVWIDYNNNGSFADAGEQIATNTTIATGSNNTTQTLSFTVPANAITGASLGLRTRLTSVTSPGPTGTAGTGEVEDNVVNIAVPTTDFGDWNGAADASSIASSNLRMGALADTEYVSTRNANANGDDITGSDDEDGVTLSTLTPGTTGGLSVVVTNNSGATAYLNAWIDFNNNGVFTDAGEQIATNNAVATNTNAATRALSFTVPADAIPGQRGARFRFTSTQTPGPTGHSGTGEVEDYLVSMNCPVITFSPTSLGGGITGAAYSQTISASGGRTPYTYSIVSGTLPADLTLDSSTGVISGTLATSSAATFTVRVTDGNTCFVNKAYTITPSCPAMTMTPSSMSAAVVGEAFSQTVAANGGTAPYTYALTSGTLPAGLTLNTSTGEIAGTATSTVPAVFTIRATDAYGCTLSTPYGMTAGCAAIDIAPATLSGGQTGSAYSAALSATPSATYSWKVVDGALPPGLNLNASTGVITGTPSAAGVHNFTVRASTGAATTPELEFTTYNLDLNPGDTFNIRHYVVPKDGSTRPIDWSTVRFTYTEAGANDPTSPANWNLSAFNAGQAVTVTNADANAGGNSGTGAFRIYLVRDGQVDFDDHMEIRVDPSRTSAVQSAKASPLIAAACSGTRAYNIQICPAITVNPATLPQPTVSIPYNQTVSATGGAAPYVYSVSGSLPAGLTLNNVTGAVTGTPTSTSSVTFTLTATDLNGCVGTRTQTLTPLTAPTLDFGDYAPFTSASSTMNSRLRIGALVDAETVARTDATADGDDNDNLADEDGVTIPDTITPGMSSTMTVKVTNTRGSTAYLNAWIDYNRNGVITDSGEQIATNTTVATGTSNANRNITFTVPAGASNGVAGVRVRLTSGSSPGVDGQDGFGEVEDYTVNIAPPPTLDFGDHASLPSASSTANTKLRLGATVDTETFALINADADGDDTTGSDDEDGVTLPLSITPGVTGTMTAIVTNSSGSTAYLNAWADFNRNGLLNDPGEQIATNTLIVTGTSNSSRSIAFTVPVSAGAGATPVRVRLTSVSTPGPDGQDGTGEVEDHILNVICPTLTLSSDALPNAAVGDAYSQTITTSGGNAPYSYLVVTGSLPSGLTLGTDGTLSGTPVATETQTFTVHSTDASGCTTTRSYTLAAHPKPSLGNLVWNDVDNDGQKDSNEPGVAGVPVELFKPGADNAIGGSGSDADTLVATTVTDSTGGYGFNSLDQGSYYVRITPPDNLPLASSVVVTTDNGVDNDNNGSQPGENGGPIYSPVVQLIAGGEPGSNGTGSDETTIDFGLIVGNSIIWLIDEDHTLSTALRLWSFKNYRTPATTATDYGRLKYRRPSDGVIRDIADGGDIEAMAINHFTGDIYIFSSGRITGAPANTQSLWTYNLNDAASNIGNIVLTLIGHVQMPTSGAFIEGLAYDPASKRFYMADPRDNSQNSSSTTDRLYYLDIRTLNANPMLATPLTLVGDMSGLGYSCNYTDGLEFDSDGRLYAVDGTDDHVYQINPATGAIVAITDNNISGGAGGSVDVETLAWDDVSTRLIAVDNSGQRFIEVTLNSNGSNISLASYRTGVPGMPSTADLEASAMYDTHPPRPRVGVGNAVFIDTNYNGVMDAGEGVNGVTVELFEAGDTPGVSAPAATTVTAGGGLYAFTRLLPEDYFIFIPASNFQPGAPLYRHASITGTTTTDDNLGEDGIDDANPALNGIRSANFNLAKDSEPTNATGETGTDATSDDADDDNTDLTIDFGFQDQSMSIGSLVWNDVNNNGVRDGGELGLASLTVQLYTSTNNVAGDGDDALWTGGTNFTTTSASGLYSFTELPPGKYVVRVNAPAGYITSGTPDSADNGEDNDNNGLQPGGPGTALLSPVITLTPNGESITDGDTNRNSDLTVDFGLFSGITVGNLVWNDSNNNGLKDTAETGVSGVTVELLTPGADNAIGGTGSNADSVVQTTTTNSSGGYSFTVYTAGRYYLRVTPPTTLTASSSVSVNADNGIDNDSNGVQPGGAGSVVLSPVFQLTAAGEPGTTGNTNAENTLDFGLRACPTLTLSPATPATATVGKTYSQTITASGGSAPYVLALSSGTLPAGLTFNAATGVISGTPTNTTSTSFVLRVTDASGCSGTQSFTIAPVCPALTLSPATMPAGYSGGAYNQTLTAANGTAAYNYVIQTGELPNGLFLSTTGIISGTPTVTGTFNFTVRVTDSYGCTASFDRVLDVRSLSIGNLVFEDSNNNGAKDTDEPGVADARVQLFATGTDNAIGGTGAAADTQFGTDITTTTSGAYLFTKVPPGKYYVKVTPPADYLLTGGTAATADNDIDNNNDGAQPGGSGTPLFSPVITLTGGTESVTDGDTDTDTNLTVDFGLWSSVAVGNFIFLDINGDGVRNEGESLGDIYVELYAQGATPGVDSPVGVGSSGCSCKGRYYIEGINPGNYFLHIPASQFAVGMALEGLLPVPTVVPGDDDAGQDLIYNSNPAVNGASTAVFTLRPGLCPTGAAESGGEGTIDDAIDARVDLTRDLGVVAPAGTGFAASERIRRHIITGGFTATVLPGATTFATWVQDGAIGGPNADPDDDGIANLLEYALGTDPASPLHAQRFALTVDKTTGAIVAHITQEVTTHDDIAIRIESLTDLTRAADPAAWKRVSVSPTTTINGDNTMTRHYASMEKLLVFKGLDTGFLRLKIELDADRDGVPEASAVSAIHAWSRQTFATGTRTFSMPLLQAAVHTGKVASVSGQELVFPSFITLPAGSSHYLDVIDGPYAGQRFEIDAAASYGNTIVLQAIAPLLAGSRVAIRPHHTLGALLPPAVFGAEDRVLLFDNAANNFTTLTNSGADWSDGVQSMNERVFAAHEAAMVKMTGAGTTILFTGEVRANNFVTPLNAGAQLVAPGWPAITAAPVTGLRSGPAPDIADRLRVWNGDASPELNTYTSYYLDNNGSAPSWKPQTAEPAPAPQQAPFHGLFLIRESPLLLNQEAPW